MAILSGARNKRNTFLAQKLFDRFQILFHNDKNCLISATILLGNTYAMCGDFSMASDIRLRLNQSGLRKMAGLSTTVVNGQIVVSGIKIYSL